MDYKVLYKASVEKDLKKIPKKEARRILDAIEKEIGIKPDKGESLKGKYKGLMKYRIGDYRVIYTKIVDGILVIRVGHRKQVYR